MLIIFFNLWFVAYLANIFCLQWHHGIKNWAKELVLIILVTQLHFTVFREWKIPSSFSYFYFYCYFKLGVLVFCVMDFSLWCCESKVLKIISSKCLRLQRKLCLKKRFPFLFLRKKKRNLFHRKLYQKKVHDLFLQVIRDILCFH